MKNIILLAVLLLSSNIFAQQNFKWEKVDSIAKTKKQLYADTKMFIAKEWKSAQNVIQNDDKESGTILVKAKTETGFSFAFAFFTYTYSYTVIFRMKDNKYKITIENVFCDRGYSDGGTGVGHETTLIPPFDGDNVYQEHAGFPPKKKAITMMDGLRQELQSIIDDYQKQIQMPSTASEDW